jgi:hypothetical protein
MTAVITPIEPATAPRYAPAPAASVPAPMLNRRQAREATDHDLWRAMTLGALVGIPITYAIGVTLAVLALGVSHLGTALAIGAVAPIFGGFWVGGLGMMIHAGKVDAQA